MPANDRETLVVFLCETRGQEITSRTVQAHLLEPLHADLALCVGSNDPPRGPFVEMARFIWHVPEFQDWGDAYELESGGRDWEPLLTIHEQFLGGIDSVSSPNVGSGAIIFYFRRRLREFLDKTPEVFKYKWVLVTRSDFLWPTRHPSTCLLDPKSIYTLDGESYGGFTDRYVMGTPQEIIKYLSLVDDLFDCPEDLYETLSQVKKDLQWDFMNPERFLLVQAQRKQLDRKMQLLPYMPFSVRAPSGTTRWSRGFYSPELGYYIKYPTEFARAHMWQQMLEIPDCWARWFSAEPEFMAEYLTRLEAIMPGDSDALRQFRHQIS